MSRLIKTLAFYLLAVATVIPATFLLVSFFQTRDASLALGAGLHYPELLIGSGLITGLVAVFVREKLGTRFEFPRSRSSIIRMSTLLTFPAFLIAANVLIYFLFGSSAEAYWILRKSTLHAESVAIFSLDKLPLAPKSHLSPNGKLSFSVSRPHEYGWSCIDTCPTYYVVTVMTTNGETVGTYYTDYEITFAYVPVDESIGDEVRWSTDSKSLYLLPSQYENGRQILATYRVIIPE